MSRQRHGLKYGLCLGILQVANVQILTWLGLGLTSWVMLGDKILLVLLVVAAHLAHRSRSESVLVFRDALIINVIIIVVAALITQTYMYIYVTSIEPGWIDKVAEIRQQMLLDSGADVSSIDDRLADFRAAFAPARMFSRGIIVPGLWDFLFAGIVALCTRSRHKPKKS